MSYGLRAFWRDFAVQQQVIGGIMMREMMTRWGRRSLGFAWLFCELLIFASRVSTGSNRFHSLLAQQLELE